MQRVCRRCAGGRRSLWGSAELLLLPTSVSFGVPGPTRDTSLILPSLSVRVGRDSAPCAASVGRLKLD